MPIDRLLRDTTELWHACGTMFTPPGRTYTAEEQAANAIELADAREKMLRHMPSRDASDSDREQSHKRMAAAFVHFARSDLSLDDSHAALLLHGGFTDIAPPSIARPVNSIQPSPMLKFSKPAAMRGPLADSSVCSANPCA